MKKVFQIFIVFWGCILWFSTVMGEDLVFYMGHPDFFFYDRESINNPDENSRDIIGVWQKVVYADKSVARISAHLGGEYSDLRESVSLIEINCLSKDAQTKAVTYYNSKGGVIHTSHRTKDNWEEISPASPMDRLYKAVCLSR